MAHEGPIEKLSASGLLSEQTIEAAFPVRFPEFRCVVCATENFFVLDDLPRLGQTADEYGEIAARHSRSNVNTVTIACAECGHTYSFVEPLLLRTLEKGRLSADRPLS